MSCLVCSSPDLYEEDIQNPFPLVKKLKICIPEIEWQNTDNFCNICAIEINKFQYFKTECLKAYLLVRKKPLELLGDLIQEPEEKEISDDSSSQTLPSSTFPKAPNDDSTNILDISNCTVKTTHNQDCDYNVTSTDITSDIQNTLDVGSETAAQEDNEKTKGKGRRPVRRYSCEVCGEFFKYASYVVKHAVKEHNMEGKLVKPYSCELCQMRFSCSGNLLQHKKYHDRTRSLMCAFCGKAFITKGDLDVHELTHINERRYKCETCGKAFNTNKTLRGHILVCHTNPALWKYACAVCEKRFPRKFQHDEHLKRHLGDKQYDCHLCDKAFVSPTELKRHIGIHSNIRRFICLLCEKEYKNNRVYKIHLKKAHDIGNVKVPVRAKKLTCHVCGSMFVDKQKLKRHMCSHTGVKPFPCDLCVKKFTDKSHLKSHKKCVHGILEVDDNCYITIL